MTTKKARMRKMGRMRVDWAREGGTKRRMKRRTRTRRKSRSLPARGRDEADKTYAYCI